MTDLARSACRRLCRWRPTGDTHGGLPLFRCAGCRSEWVRTEGWAPVDADGSRDAALEAEVAARRAAPPPDPPTSDPGADGAGSAGRCGSTGS